MVPMVMDLFLFLWKAAGGTGGKGTVGEPVVANC